MLKTNISLISLYKVFLISMKNYSEQSPAYRKETITKKDLEPPKQIILIGGGTGWHFTDRPFAAHFEYTPIYKSIATFKLEGTKVSCNSEAIIEELKNKIRYGFKISFTILL